MMKKDREEIKDTCFTLVSDFVRWSDVNCETSYYEMMNFLWQNDEIKIFMLNTSKLGFVWWNAVFAGGKKRVLNRGPQCPQPALEPLSLSTMLQHRFFTFI